MFLSLSLSLSLTHTHTHTHHTADNAFKGQAVDIWAAGITLYVFMFGRVSWKFISVQSKVFDSWMGVWAQVVVYTASIVLHVMYMYVHS